MIFTTFSTDISAAFLGVLCALFIAVSVTSAFQAGDVRLRTILILFFDFVIPAVVFIWVIADGRGVTIVGLSICLWVVGVVSTCAFVALLFLDLLRRRKARASETARRLGVPPVLGPDGRDATTDKVGRMQSAQIPTFPTETGDQASVTFVKDGTEYRLMRFDANTWLIHKRGATREAFELVLTPDGENWDVEGRGHVGPVSAPFVTTEMIWARLF